MDIRFQPALLQEVIDSFIEKTEREGDPTYYKEFHELADPIYEKYTLEDREPEFKKLYQYLFGTWGFSDIINSAFDEYPTLEPWLICLYCLLFSLPSVLFGLALGKLFHGLRHRFLVGAVLYFVLAVLVVFARLQLAAVG